jgi:periplasmic divalent cation tolerance protein
VKITLFYIPAPSESAADLIGKTLLAEKLVACMHVFPVQSSYPWQGVLQSDAEFILLLKTLPPCEELVAARVRALHTYNVPAILHWRVKANADYIDWMKREIQLPASES